jgi:hypothetical protein
LGITDNLVPATGDLEVHSTQVPPTVCDHHPARREKSHNAQQCTIRSEKCSDCQHKGILLPPPQSKLSLSGTSPLGHQLSPSLPLDHTLTNAHIIPSLGERLHGVSRPPPDNSYHARSTLQSTTAPELPHDKPPLGMDHSQRQHLWPVASNDRPSAYMSGNHNATISLHRTDLAYHSLPTPPSSQPYGQSITHAQKPNVPQHRSVEAPLVPRKTFRATQACNHCRARKQKCDEARPCHFCKANSVDCQYKDVTTSKYVHGYRRA